MEQDARRVTYIEAFLAEHDEIRKLIKTAYLIETLPEGKFRERCPATSRGMSEAKAFKNMFECLSDTFSSLDKLEEKMRKVREQDEEMERIDAEIPLSKLLGERA